MASFPLGEKKCSSFAFGIEAAMSTAQPVYCVPVRAYRQPACSLILLFDKTNISGFRG